MATEKSPDYGDESFLHEHAKELAIGSALGMLGLVYVVAHRRMARETKNTESDELPESGGANDNL